MKQRIHSSDDKSAEPEGIALPSADEVAPVQLDSVQKQILDRLGRDDSAVTWGQLQNAVSCGENELKEALERLVKVGLVCRLNTVIPSYAHRYPGIRVYGE